MDTIGLYLHNRESRLCIISDDRGVSEQTQVRLVDALTTLFGPPTLDA
jgi:hypothetical protein